MCSVKKLVEKTKKTIKNKWIKILICLIVPALFGLVVEGISGLSLLANRELIQEEVALEQVVLENFALEQGELLALSEDATLRINFGESRYINKLFLSYTSYEPIEMIITTVKDRGGGESAKRRFRKNANMLQEFTALPLGKSIHYMTIRFTGEFENKGLAINEISINNEFHFSPWRFFFFYVLLLLFLMILLFKSEFVGKEQRFFFVAGILMGMVAITSMPPHMSGWDEEVHFKRSYGYSNLMRFNREYYVSPTIIFMSAIHIETWPWHYPNTMEDRRHLVEKYNELDTDAYRGVARHYRRPWSNFGGPISFILLSPGYVSQAAFLAVGRILQLPFSMLYMFGRLGNLILYLTVGYFAIKRSVIGKKIMTALLLMPTPLFLATVYSYDATINAFIALGVACILREIYGKEEKVSYLNLCIFVISIVIASMPKAIFAPLLLLGLLVPKEKYTQMKHLTVVRAGVIGGTLILLATFVLPALVDTIFATAGSTEVADPRGGDTNVARQMRHIFSQPISYGVGMLQIMYGTIVEYSIGPSAMGKIGHGFLNSMSGAPAILLTAVCFTESGMVKIKKQHKIMIALLLFVISSLIWTALYLAFTPVAHPYIVGVQGRYFIPLMLIGLLLINGRGIDYKCEEKTYNSVLFTFIGLITMTSFYGTFVINNM